MRDRRGDFGLANVDEDDFVVPVPPGLIGQRSPRGITPCLAAHEQFDHVELSEVGDPVELAHAEGVSCPGAAGGMAGCRSRSGDLVGDALFGHHSTLVGGRHARRARAKEQTLHGYRDRERAAPPSRRRLPGRER